MPRIKVYDTELYFESNGTGEPVVNVHGSAFGRGNFASLTPLLAQQFRVIDSDLRGFGDSDAPLQDFSMERWADDLVHLLDALGLERVHVHGTSMGGMVAISLAARYPGRVDRLVLSCSLAKYDRAAEINKRVWRAIAAAYGKGEEFLDLMMLQLFSRSFLDDSDRMEDARELVARLIASQTSAEVFERINRAIEAADLRPYLQSITAPTLVIAARHDIATPFRMGPSGAGSSTLVEDIPGAKLVMMETAHMFLVEKPQETCDIITEFLTREHIDAGVLG